MSDRESALARWSRLKRVSLRKEEARPAEPPKAGDPELPATPSASSEPADQRPEDAAGSPLAAEERFHPAIDPATLPPIESIGAGTDIRAFLQTGVPAALTREALRRAWAADPLIRDFVEMAENQWDFNNPASIPGFGPLNPTDNVQKLVEQALGKWRDAPEHAPPQEQASGLEAPSAASASPPTEGQKSAADIKPSASDEHTDDPYANKMHEGKNTEDYVATQHEPEDGFSGSNGRRSRHGKALPQ